VTSLRDVSVGIDVAEARRGLDLVVLDAERQVLACYAHLSIEAAAELVLHEFRPTVVCIDSPAQWSQAGSNREAERVLRRLGINAFQTPLEERAGRFHDWMRVGFAMYEALSPAYPRYRGGAVIETAAEYFPHASAVALAGRIGQFKDKLAFRHRVLEENGVRTSSLRTLDQVDAALGALTGRIALDGGHCWVGDADEGPLLLPVSTLPERWLREDATAGRRSADGTDARRLPPHPRTA
jgi:predicted nuclease with RNAse H fold